MSWRFSNTRNTYLKGRESTFSFPVSSAVHGNGDEKPRSALATDAVTLHEGCGTVPRTVARIHPERIMLPLFLEIKAS